MILGWNFTVCIVKENSGRLSLGSGRLSVRGVGKSGGYVGQVGQRNLSGVGR